MRARCARRRATPSYVAIMPGIPDKLTTTCWLIQHEDVLRACSLSSARSFAARYAQDIKHHYTTSSCARETCFMVMSRNIIARRVHYAHEMDAARQSRGVAPTMPSYAAEVRAARCRCLPNERGVATYDDDGNAVATLCLLVHAAPTHCCHYLGYSVILSKQCFGVRDQSPHTVERA